MSSEQDTPPAPRPARPWALVGFAAAVVLGVAAVAGIWLLPMTRGGETAAPAAAVEPSPAEAAPPAPVVETPGVTIEASREPKPRPRRRAEPPPPPPAAEPPTTGELYIDSDVPGAMVFIDRKFIGNAPVTAKDVPLGTHHLNVTAEGHEGYSEPIEVAVGPATIMVKFKEIRLKEAIDVVHKHTIGSCEGRLLADPQGVRYETTNESDAFTLRFSEIETFEVDYLKKNLLIKKRGGKRYNFTTKADNADPLFVFHRNVEKVRQQVAGAAPAKK